MKARFLLLIVIALVFSRCAPELSNIKWYQNYLLENKSTVVYLDDVVVKLGDPDVLKEHENDIVASWTKSFSTRSPYGARDVGGEKLIITFDKNKKMVTWDFKTW